MMRRVPALFLALVISGTAFGDEVDPPARAARLSLMQGQVVLQAAGGGAPEAAELNRPLTVGDRLMTDTGSRAEMSVGTAAVRLDESTDLTIANLDDDIAQIELNSGTLGIHLRELREGETFEIDTPNATVLLLRPGDYRIEVDSQGASVLAVRNGEAELDGGAGPTRLTDQQELRYVDPDQTANVESLGPLSEFDEWCIERERAVSERHATRYVSREVVGYEDLDYHGRWYDEPGYGYVWSPSYISIGWAPYTYGRWTWISPWGFTWIDFAPWGYAPFHYGRWAYLNQRWCWVPPGHHHRPVFAPALVGWHGMHGVRDPRHAGSVSWYPLGPREVYVPGNRVSSRYLRNVNVSNTAIENNAQITNAYRGRVRNARPVNSSIPGAVTTMPAGSFAAQRTNGGNVLRVDPNQPERITPPVQTPQPISDNRWREAFNNVRGREAGAAPTTTLQPQPNERAVKDERRTVPRMPNERRMIQGNVNDSRSATQVPAMRFVERERPVARTEPPRTNIRTEPPRTVVRTEPPRTVVRTEPSRTMGQPEQRRVAPSESWQNQRVQQAPSQTSRSVQTDSGRSNNGGGSSSSSRSYGGSSSSSSYGGGSSYQGSSGNRGGSMHSGSSGSSGSRGNSGRGGGVSTSRP